jgi:hypothetical protein
VPLIFVVGNNVVYQTATDPSVLAKLKQNALSKIVIGGGNTSPVKI